MTLRAALALVRTAPAEAAITVRRCTVAGRAHIAAILAGCLEHRGSPHVRRVTHEAERARGVLERSTTLDDEIAAYHGACTIRRACQRLPPADQTPTLVAVLRALLDDAEGFEALDRAVRDAARAHDHAIDERHERAASRIIGEAL